MKGLRDSRALGWFAPSRWVSPRNRLFVAAGAAAVVVAVVAWLVVPPMWADHPAAESRSAPSAAASNRGAAGSKATSKPTDPAAAAAPAGGSAPDPAASRAKQSGQLLAAASAPRTHAVELMQVLSDARATALTTRDVKALDQVYSASSSSRQEDVTKIKTLLAGGNAYSGLGLEVAQATWVTGDAAKATIRSRVDWTDYVVQNDSGAQAAKAAQVGELLDFHLVRGATGWRIQSITSASAT
jgi:hypothetical protein